MERPGEKEFLASYRQKDYPKPSVTVDLAVFAKDGDKRYLLMVRRKNHPYRGYWALPGGFVDSNETTEAAAHRELMEETSLGGQSLVNFGVYSTPNRDPRGWTISVAYLAEPRLADCVVEAADDAADARWFEILAERNEDGLFTFKLYANGAQANAVLRLTRNEFDSLTFTVESSELLAFDHAVIVADACKRIGLF